MEVDKFEKHIKKHLKEREISPSERAWDTLSEQLPKAGAKKKNKFLWYSVAAAFIGVLIVSTLYVKRNQAPTEMPIEVVDTEMENKLKDFTIKESVQFKSEEEVVEVSSDAKTKEKTVEDVEHIIPKVSGSIVLDDEIEVAVNQVPTGRIVEKLVVSDEIINSKVADIIAQVTVLEQTSTVTDAEVDSLLKRAQDEILREKIFNKDKSVDAMALLTEVEDELDQSFRDQIFASLKAGFVKVRTAVADRNN
ncbi:hypothetical protein [Maribacter luteus]|uniref:hypothetical protein n=1 Tax=Maribacter luteus TaxID=2594478 RepID=UPI00248FAC5B|nr:hypothetical protein [Maribacter luteus]